MSGFQGQPWSDNPDVSNTQLEEVTLAGMVIGSILYGLVIMLFSRCMATLFNPIYRRGGRIKWGLVSYTMAIFSIATAFTAVNFSIQLISFSRFVEDGLFGYQTPIGPTVLRIVPSVMFLLNGWLADGLLLYRCYVIYSMNHWIIAFPCLMYVGILAMGILIVYQSLTPGIWATVYSNFVLLYLSASSSLNVLLTLAIVIRLTLHARNIRVAVGAPAGIGGSRKLIVSILIESSALYSVSSLLVLGPWIIGSSAVEVLLPVLAETQVIAPLLIVQRVANGSALTSDDVMSGRIDEINLGSRGELTIGRTAHPGGYSSSLITGVRVDTTIDFHRDKA